MLDLFHFLRPWWFLAFIPALLLFIFILKTRQANHQWQSGCDPHLLKHLIIGDARAYNNLSLALVVLLSWCIAIVALAGPTWSHQIQPTWQKSTARVIALDLSVTMNANDLLPTRLARARFKVLDLLKAITEGQTGMIVFSDLPFVVSPLTSDAHTIANMVPVLDTDIVPVPGNNTALALEESAKLIHQAGSETGQIILITDSTPNTKAYNIAKKLNNDGIKTSVLAIGTEQGGPIANKEGGFLSDKQGNIIFANLDTPALEKLAQSGGGIYVPFTNNNSDITQLLAQNAGAGSAQKTTRELNNTKALWKDQGHWLIWLLMLISAILARKIYLERLCR